MTTIELSSPEAISALAENSTVLNAAPLITTETAIVNATPTLTPKKRRWDAFNNEAFLVLKSRAARFYFFRGGKPEGGVGVIYFAKQMSDIWKAAALDDPYADLFLLRVYDGLKTIQREIRQLIKQYRETIQKEIRFDWHTTLTDEPEKIKLHFKQAYGFMAANLIAVFDEYACLLYAANQLGVVLDKSARELLAPIGEKIRVVFELPQHYTKLDITREDIRQQNDKAKTAAELMGQLNEKVLEGTLRAPHAPRIKTQNLTPSDK